jgi:cell division protein FtsZ
MSTPLNFEFADEIQLNAKMKVVGVGGAGGNAVDRMILSGLTGAEFISINTDAQALDRTLAQRKLQIGKQLTKGLGVGADPNKGREAAEQDEEMITEILRDADLIFITAGMGGGTGTGAAPKVAEIARSLGILTVAIVTKPFAFEGNRRMAVAEHGVRALREQVDTLVVIPNQRLLSVVDASTTFLDSFKRADSVLTDATRGIADLISIPGIVNLDFADVRAIMSGSGDALMGIGVAVGEERGKKAAQMAIHSPLLEDVSISGAQGVLVNVTGSPDMTLFEVSEAATEVTNAAGENANVIFGAVIDENVGEEIRVTVIATGFGRSSSAPLPKLPDCSADFIPKNTNELLIPTITRTRAETERASSDPPKGNGNRIRLEVNVDEDPPTDFGIPTFLRKNGHRQQAELSA